MVADFSWFSDHIGNTVPQRGDARSPDDVSAPKSDCNPSRMPDDPAAHRFCCRPHEVAEAEWSDQLADRRARGELNPEKWPPVVDGDAFEVTPAGAPVGDPNAGAGAACAGRRHDGRPGVTMTVIFAPPQEADEPAFTTRRCRGGTPRSPPRPRRSSADGSSGQPVERIC